MPAERLIDVSELDAPEPFEAALQLVSQLKKGEYIRMLHRKQPLPLIEILSKQGYECHVKPGHKTQWEIIIWNKNDSMTHDYCVNHFS